MGIKGKLLGLCLVFMIACGGALQPPGSTDNHADDGIVFVISAIKDAEVWIDGKKINRIRRLGGGLQIAPGAYRLEVRHPDYFTFYLKLLVKKNDRQRIEVTLAKNLS